jgi:molybdate transport system substrate-binding protein
MRAFLGRFILALVLVAAGRILAGEITVFAAASLTDSLKEVAASYEKTTGEKVRFNFAASNVLAQQIQAGAPADIFFSADAAKMDALDKVGLIARDTRKDLLGNSLVIITTDEKLTFTKADDLKQPSIRRLALGDSKAVPAGIYAKAWLENAGLWVALQPKIVSAENVRAAMAVVESGNAQAGIVYKTDAGISKTVRIAFEIPTVGGPTITYPAAVMKDSRNGPSARKFLTYLADTKADEIFAKHGFSVIE